MFGVFNSPIEKLDARAIAPSAVAALLAGVLAVVGSAMLVEWQPLAETVARWELPRWSSWAIGALLIAAAAVSLTEWGGFYAAIASAAVMLSACALYGREGEYFLAALPAVVLAVAGTLAALRARVVMRQASAAGSLANALVAHQKRVEANS